MHVRYFNNFEYIAICINGAMWKPRVGAKDLYFFARTELYRRHLNLFLKKVYKHQNTLQ